VVLLLGRILFALAAIYIVATAINATLIVAGWH
jgi:hypothetical protein